MSRARDMASKNYYKPGEVVQVQTIRIDTQTSYTGLTSGNGTPISALDISITPKFSTSKIIVQWEMHYEAQYNITFLIMKNGTLLSNGYNSVTGNVNLGGGYGVTAYDGGDVASTPNRITITFVDLPATTSTTTYNLGIRSASLNNEVLWLNRAYANPAGNSYEVGVSVATIQEIAQ